MTEEIVPNIQLPVPDNYDSLVNGIRELVNNARKNISKAVNTEMVNTYWHIGRYIVEFEQKGNARAEYGKGLLNNLSKDLMTEYGSGFNRSNLIYMRKLYLYNRKSGTLSHFLSWSHYYEILKIDDELERNFYIKQCELEHWSVRQLERQIDSMLFQRIALTKSTDDILNPPIGIVLGAQKDDLTMQYAMEGISNQLFAAKYQLYMP